MDAIACVVNSVIGANLVLLADRGRMLASRRTAVSPCEQSGLPAWVLKGSYHESGIGDYVVVATEEPAMTPTEADKLVEPMVRQAIQFELVKRFPNLTPA